jgi:hypothetical protein
MLVGNYYKKLPKRDVYNFSLPAINHFKSDRNKSLTRIQPNSVRIVKQKVWPVFCK